MSEKAYVSPCFQNASVKSPLEILRFPFLGAFSHKELMGLFDACWDIIVKTTKCRSMCTPRYPRSVRSDTPTVDAASCLCRQLLI